MPNDYVAEVLEKLQTNPTAQDLDYFIEAHARVGYLVSTARGRAEFAESNLKFQRATRYAESRQSGEAKSAGDADALAVIATIDTERESIRSREIYSKLANLLGSIEQAINGIKYLGRATDVNLPLTRR